MAIPQIPIPTTPRLFDKLFIKFNTNLVDTNRPKHLPWLAHAFSESQRLIKKVGDKEIIYPAVFAGKNIEGEYADVLPNEFLGRDKAIKGFSFFDCVRDITYENGVTRRISGFVNGNVGLVFWFNAKKVLDDNSEFRNLDKIIYDILQAIKDSTRGFQGEIVVEGWTKKPEEIYPGYSVRETDQQFLMHPYAGVRFECRVRFPEDC